MVVYNHLVNQLRPCLKRLKASALTKLAHLNLKALGLILKRKWIDKKVFATGYDRVASTYPQAWSHLIKPVTANLIDHLPTRLPPLPIIDLGCGTGSATNALKRCYPHHPVTGIDVSSAMLDRARTNASQETLEFRCEDMLTYLKGQSPNCFSLLFSAWAIGYSVPKQVIQQAAHKLAFNGVLAFVVNYTDTLGPVFQTLRLVMQNYPGKLRLAYVPRFPKNRAQIARWLAAAGFSIRWQNDGYHPINKPAGYARATDLDWLLDTGVLAGFDQMLPLRTDPELRAAFKRILNTQKKPLTHHYTALIAEKK